MLKSSPSLKIAHELKEELIWIYKFRSDEREVISLLTTISEGEPNEIALIIKQINIVY